MLPYVDEHTVVVSRGVEDVWTSLLETVDRRFAGDLAIRYARLVGCRDATPSGPRPLAEGSTITGFRVTTAAPGAELVLEGGHRFSDYTLTFRIEPVSEGRTRVRAETRAAFPGLTGGLYRLFVIRTGGHAVVMRRLLAGVAAGAAG